MAIFGVYHQSNLSELKKERAILALEKAEKEASIAAEDLAESKLLRIQIDTEIQQLRKQKKATESEVENLNGRLNSIRASLNDTKDDLSVARENANSVGQIRIDSVISAVNRAFDELPVVPRATATIASWNLEHAWRGLGYERAALIARGVADVDADVFVLLEMSISAADELVSALSHLGLCFRFNIIEQAAPQNIAVLYRCGTSLAINRIELIEGSNAGVSQLRKAVAAEMRVGKFDFLLIGVHFKSSVGDVTKIRKTRMAQASAISDYLEIRSKDEQDILVIGDYNFDPYKETELIDALGSSVKVIFPQSEEISAIGTYILSNGSKAVIDGFAMTDPIASEFIAGSLSVFPLIETMSLDPLVFRDSVSDHLPIVARFRTFEDND